jgi:hypothetical protein
VKGNLKAAGVGGLGFENGVQWVWERGRRLCLGCLAIALSGRGYRESGCGLYGGGAHG